MESQGNGKRASRAGTVAQTLMRTYRQHGGTWRRCCARITLFVAFLWIGLAHATSYVYDANGRVVAVTQSNGQVAQYNYDALGNLQQVTNLTAGQLAIFTFVPTHGAAGTQVTIEGQGFSTTLANDSVSFAGTAGIVLSATATAIVTQVPSGAASGPISVTVSGHTVTSAAPFTVDDTGVPPQISQISPEVINSGTSVTVTGSYLYPVANGTTATVGESNVPVTAPTETQLQIAPTTSGYVTVQTPFGRATSASPVIVLPTGFAPSSVVSSGYTTPNGAPVNLSIAGANQYGAVLFSATQGSWLSLQTSAISPSADSIGYWVYAPGNVLIEQGTVSTTSPSIHLPQLTVDGTYVVVFQPNTASTQMTVAVTADATLSTSVGATLVMSTPYQTQRLLYQATAGQNLVFAVNSSTTSPANNSISYTFYSPIEAQYTYNPLGTEYTYSSFAGTGVINLPGIPLTGTYQIVIGPNNGATTTTQVEMMPAASGTQSTNGTSQTYAATANGEDIYMSFNASQGQNLELTFNDINITGATYDAFYVNVYNSAGTNITGYWCYQSNPGASCSQSLWNLPAGTYSVIIQPSYGGELSFNAILQPDTVEPALKAATPVSLTLGAGQVQRYTFSATAGSTYALDLSSVTTTPAGQDICVSIYAPNIGAITGSNYYTYTCATSGPQIVNLPYLPASGTYTVVVWSSYEIPASATLELVSGAAGTQPTNGTSETYAANVAGQNVYMSFTATQGQNLELTLNNVNVTGASYNAFSVEVYDAAGNGIASFGCYNSNPGSSCTQSLWNLAAGHYTVVATPDWGGVIQFDAILQPDTIGTALTADTSSAITLAAGQVERLTFNGTAGQTSVLELSGVTTTPANQNVTVTVYAPNAGQITPNNYYTYTYTSTNNGAAAINFSNLPLSGTYTVIVSSAYGLPATAQLLLTSGLAATQPTNGTSETYTTDQSGQDVFLSFTATQGQNLELTFNNISMTGSSQNYFNVYVYDTTTGAYITSFSCSPSDSGSSCTQSLWNLAAGQYSITVYPVGGGTVSFNTILVPDVVGPALVAGTAANVTLAAGQVERYTFTGTLGGTVALELSGVTTSANYQYVTVNVYRPDVGQITTTDYYTNTNASSGATTLNLSNLPVGGTYTVIVSSTNGIPASAQLLLVKGVTATQATNGTTASYSENAAGENLYLSFSATQGQNLELTFNDINFSGTTNGSLYYNVYNSSGTNIASNSCYQSDPGSSCTQSLWNLAAGQYTIVVQPNSNTGILSLDAIIRPDVVGPALTPGTATNVTLAAGQVERYTFSGTLGGTMALELSGATTTPTGQPVYVSVYRPDVGQIETNNTYVSTNTYYGASTLNLSDLPVSGTYTVVVSSAYGLPASAQLLLVNGVTATQPTTGASETYKANEIGQDIYFSFTATQGQNLELTLNNISQTGGATNPFEVIVSNASGSTVADFWCYPGQSTSCTQSLWNLSAGQYSVVAEPASGEQLNFSALLQPDITGPTISAGYPANVTLNAGQAERVTFNANVRDTVALQLTGTTVPAGQNVNVSIYRPDAGWITTGNAYASTSSSGSTTTLTLPLMPASGTYTAVITTTYGLPATATFGVEYDNSNSPPAYGTANLQSNGTAQSEAAAAAGDNVTMTFNATQGQNLELTMNNINVTGASYNAFSVAITDPWGNSVASYYCYASNPGSSCNQSLWNLSQGTYTVTVTPNWGGVINFNAILSADVVGSALTAGTPVNISLGAAQTERFTFNGTLGSTVALALSNVATTPANQNVYVNVYSPAGGLITTGNYYTYTYTSNGTSTLNLTNLPATGTYTAVVYSQYGLPFTAQLELANGVTGAQATNGTAVSYATTDQDQNAYFTFTAAQNQNLELTLYDVAVTGGNDDYINVYVYTSEGQQIAYFTCWGGNPNGSCTQSLWNLAAGTYTVVAEPAWGGTISFNAMVQPDIVGAALTAGTPANITLGTGQAERFTFTGTLGGTVALELSGVTTTPSGQNVYVNVYAPNGGLITPSSYYSTTNTAGTTTLNLTNLPASGAYTVVAYTGYGIPATAQLTLANGVTGTQPTNGTSESYATTISGQNVYLSFTATQGQNLEFTLNNLVLTGSSNNLFSVTVYQNSNGAQVGWTQCWNESAGPSCSLPLWNLEAGGYTAVISPETGGVMSFNAIVQPDVVGPALTVGTAVNVSLAAGQAERYTFSGTLGSDVALELLNAATTPAGQDVYVTVYAPTSGLITTSNYYAQTNTGDGNPVILNLSNLPASGTYTVVVSASGNLPATAQLLLANGTSATVPTNGTFQSYTTTESGQYAYLSFTATQGENVEVTLNNLQVTNSNSSSDVVYLMVYSGGNFITNTACYQSNPASSCNLSLWNLSAGNYTVVVQPSYGGEMQFDAAITADVTAGAIVAGTPVNVSLNAGQVKRYTFSGTFGSSVSLELNNVITTPAGQSVGVLVYAPDGGAIQTDNSIGSTSSSGGPAILNLTSLPASGTYTVVVYGYYGLPATAQLTLATDDTGTQPTNGTAKSYIATQTGQDVVFTFNATQNQNLEFTLNNISIAGETNDNLQVTIAGQNGSNTTIYCYASTSAPSCTDSLWNMAAGTYTVTVSPMDGGTLQFDAIIAADVAGPAVTASAPANINLAAGQAERLTFAGMLGGTVNLNLSNVTTTDGQTVYVKVYQPNIGPITTSNYYTYTYAASGGSASMNLTDLPLSGTYTAVVYTSLGLPATAQLSIAPSDTGSLSSTMESFTAGGVGQTLTTTFAATSGQNLELTLNNINASGGSTDGFEVFVTSPSGESIANFYCYGTTPGASCSQSLWNLTAGTYTVTASPIWGGLISFNAMILPDVSGPTLASGTAADITLNTGQVERVKFAGTAGDSATLQLASVTTTPANQNVYVYVYLPNVGTITTTDAYEVLQATGSNTLTIPDLPVTGTYTAVVETGTGIPATAQVTYTQ